MNITQQKYFLCIGTSQTINELEISEQVSIHIKWDSNNRPKRVFYQKVNLENSWVYWAYLQSMSEGLFIIVKVTLKELHYHKVLPHHGWLPHRNCIVECCQLTWYFLCTPEISRDYLHQEMEIAKNNRWNLRKEPWDVSFFCCLESINTSIWLSETWLSLYCSALLVAIFTWKRQSLVQDGSMGMLMLYREERGHTTIPGLLVWVRMAHV